MDTDVIVIGAGAAGLAAALWLAERSIRVVALEGRDRIGGRVMWQSLGTGEAPAELGAEFIHGPAPETTAFLDEAGLTSLETGGPVWICNSTGELRAVEEDFSSVDVFERASSLVADESVDAFLRPFEQDPQWRDRARRARAFVEGFEAADPALASVRAIADEVRTGVDSSSSRPVGSYAPLFEHLAGRCARAGVDLRLGTTVERITWAPGNVTIEARSGNGALPPIRARCAIATVPVGILHRRGNGARLSFTPPLPAEKQAAIDGLEMGHAVRVALAFRTPFWEHVAGGRYRDAAFFRCEAGTFNAFWTQLPLRSRSIVAWAGGPRATAMNGTSIQERIDRARDQFGAMFGERDLARREFEAGATHDWSVDPFANGAYSYVATGAGAARAALGAPIAETLFFAGEATATDGQGGTVSGSFATGLRAAREAARAIGVADAKANGT
jgi:monoamine oxidase